MYWTKCTDHIHDFVLFVSYCDGFRESKNQPGVKKLLVLNIKSIVNSTYWYLPWATSPYSHMNVRYLSYLGPSFCVSLWIKSLLWRSAGTWQTVSQYDGGVEKWNSTNNCSRVAPATTEAWRFTSLIESFPERQHWVCFSNTLSMAINIRLLTYEKNANSIFAVEKIFSVFEAKNLHAEARVAEHHVFWNHKSIIVHFMTQGTAIIASGTVK